MVDFLWGLGMEVEENNNNRIFANHDEQMKKKQPGWSIFRTKCIEQRVATG